MKLYHWLLLGFLFSCQSKKTEKIVKLPAAPKEDTIFSYRKLLHIPSEEQEESGYYKDFLEGKKALQLSDSLAFTNDYEIRVYIFGSLGPSKCFRYTLHNNEWEGEMISKTDISATPPKRHSIYPKYGWRAFIENVIKNGLLEMPTQKQADQDLKEVMERHHYDYPVILDGQWVMVELISKDFYDLRMYNKNLSLAEDYPEAVVLNKIHNLVIALTQIKVNDVR